MNGIDLNISKRKAAITKESRANNERNAKNDKRYKFKVTNDGVTTYHRLWIKANKRAIHEHARFDAVARIKGR